jgi:tetratricopeptide (TPR) repeat protein
LNRTLIALLSLLLVMTLTMPAGAADPPRCKLGRIAEWPVRLENNVPVIEGAINGKKARILLSTGSFASYMSQEAATRFGLPTKGTDRVWLGSQDEARVFVTRIDEFRIGDAVRKNMGVRVAGERSADAVDFVLGNDFFKNLDMEFDYAKGMIRLFHAQDCKGVFLGYWDAKALEVELENEEQIVVPLRINGREARARISSGSSTSVVSLPFAARLGITPQSPGVAPAGCHAGFAGEIEHTWVAPFDSVTIGPQTIRNARMLIEDFLPRATNRSEFLPEVLLGTDFLRAHRVFVVRSQEKVYISYAGGLVFPATPSFACQDKDGKDPGESQKLVRQAAELVKKGDEAGALAALDSALRLNPKDPVALYTRAVLHLSRKRYEAALADIDAGIANGMRNGNAYVCRAAVNHALGKFDSAILDLDEAVNLAPTSRDARGLRGWHHYITARYEAADRDHSAMLETPHRPHDVLWLHISRLARGLDARAALEREHAALKGEWPAPVMGFFLGHLDREALAATAEGAPAKDREVHVCEARYYMAQQLLHRGATADGKALLEKVVAECPREHVEYGSAVIQLKRLP